MMRIISGKFKGKLINFTKTKSTRPLKDSVKENIFNIITHSNKFKINIQKSNILDLYSGFGSFGLECISRGAASATFFENDSVALNILNKNLSSLPIQNKAIIINDNIKNIEKKIIDKKFEIIFLDPPYSDNEYLNLLKTIKINKLHKKNHIVIIHREKKSEDNFFDVLKIKVEKNYGRSKVIFGIFA